MSCCGRKVQGIGMGQMAMNFMLSVGNAINHAVKTKKVMAERSIVDARVAECKKCKFMKNSRCQACGCYIVVKVALDSEKCPKGFW